MVDFLDDDELAALGLASFGHNVKISRRALLLAPETISIGDNSRIDAFAVLSGNAEGVVIGRNVHISAHATILGRGRAEIGDFCAVGVRCCVFTSGDNLDGTVMTNPTVPEHYRGQVDGPVTLGRHVVLATGAVVLPHVTVGASAAIGALSLVKKDVPPFAIMAGCPARQIGQRRPEHLALEAEYLAQEDSGR